MEIQRRFYAEGILLPSIVCEAEFSAAVEFRSSVAAAFPHFL